MSLSLAMTLALGSLSASPAATGIGSSSHLARAALQSMNPVMPWYTVGTEMLMLDFVGNWRCNKALHLSAEAACLAEAGVWVNQTIFPILMLLLHRYYVL